MSRDTLPAHQAPLTLLRDSTAFVQYILNATLLNIKMVTSNCTQCTCMYDILFVCLFINSLPISHLVKPPHGVGVQDMTTVQSKTISF